MAMDVMEGRVLPAPVVDHLDGAAVLVIDGVERARASDGATIPTVDPATEQLLLEIPEASADDVDDAVGAAASAHADGRWRSLPPAKRARVLLKVADAITRDADALGWLDTLDQGKPLRAATGEMIAAAETFRYFAGLIQQPRGTVIPARPGRFVYADREPIGVCAQIIPWNFPALMAAWKLAPALAFGNTCVLKPAEQTPLSALWLVRLLAEAGVPDGVVNLVQGRGEVTGQALISHPQVDKIAFTGSTEVGQHIMRTAADTLTPVTLELGGKSPNVVFADAGDLDTLARKVAGACFANAGEVCTAGTRLVVEAAIHDELVTKVVEVAQRMRVAPGWAPKAAMGPLVSAEQRDRVGGYVALGQREGAELITGGGAPDGLDERGFFFAPTVFDGVTPSMRVAQEEIFGPVLAVQRFDDEAEAIALANDVSYGLAAAVWTSDLGLAHRMAGALVAGTVWVNTYGELDVSVPFGGMKHSGIGRELGPSAVEAYTVTKSVWMAT